MAECQLHGKRRKRTSSASDDTWYMEDSLDGPNTREKIETQWGQLTGNLLPDFESSNERSQNTGTQGFNAADGRLGYSGIARSSRNNDANNKDVWNMDSIMDGNAIEQEPWDSWRNMTDLIDWGDDTKNDRQVAGSNVFALDGNESFASPPPIEPSIDPTVKNYGHNMSGKMLIDCTPPSAFLSSDIMNSINMDSTEDMNESSTFQNHAKADNIHHQNIVMPMNTLPQEFSSSRSMTVNDDDKEDCTIRSGYDTFFEGIPILMHSSPRSKHSSLVRGIKNNTRILGRLEDVAGTQREQHQLIEYGQNMSADSLDDTADIVNNWQELMERFGHDSNTGDSKLLGYSTQSNWQFPDPSINNKDLTSEIDDGWQALMDQYGAVEDEEKPIDRQKNQSKSILDQPFEQTGLPEPLNPLQHSNAHNTVLNGDGWEELEDKFEHDPNDLTVPAEDDANVGTPGTQESKDEWRELVERYGGTYDEMHSSKVTNWPTKAIASYEPVHFNDDTAHTHMQMEQYRGRYNIDESSYSMDGKTNNKEAILENYSNDCFCSDAFTGSSNSKITGNLSNSTGEIRMRTYRGQLPLPASPKSWRRDKRTRLDGRSIDGASQVTSHEIHPSPARQLRSSRPHMNQSFDSELFHMAPSNGPLSKESDSLMRRR